MDSINNWVERSVREWMSTFNERIARARCRRLMEEIVIFIRDRVGPVINNLRGQVDSLNREIRTLKREVQGLNQQSRSLNLELQQLREQVSEHQNRLRTLEEEKCELTMQLLQIQDSNTNPRGFPQP